MAKCAFCRKGPELFYLTSTEAYRLTPAELMGLLAWEHHQGSYSPSSRRSGQSSPDGRKLQTAARSGMRIDLSHFERLDVVVRKTSV